MWLASPPVPTTQSVTPATACETVVGPCAATDRRSVRHVGEIEGGPDGRKARAGALSLIVLLVLVGLLGPWAHLPLAAVILIVAGAVLAVSLIALAAWGFTRRRDGS